MANRVRTIAKLLDGIQVEAAHKLWVSICPPYVKPQDESGKRLNANMKEELELPPLIVLINRPDIVDSDGPELLSQEAFRFASDNVLTVVEVHVLPDCLPVTASNI